MKIFYLYATLLIFTTRRFDSAFFILYTGNILILNEIYLLTNIISLYDIRKSCELNPSSDGITFDVRQIFDHTGVCYIMDFYYVWLTLIVNNVEAFKTCKILFYYYVIYLREHWRYIRSLRVQIFSKATIFSHS